MGNASIKPEYTAYIGRGSFGFVYKGTYAGQAVAVKTINRHMLRERYQNVDSNEIVPFIKGLNHPNVIQILAWEDKGHEVWLALELCTCSLDDYVKDHELCDTDTSDILWQASYGIAYLHENNVVHRDVKPDNFLILVQNSRCTVKVTDFSLCKSLDASESSTMATVRGNRNWLAPELLTEEGERAPNARYKRSIDVFSFGLVILFVCLTDRGRRKLSGASCGSLVKRGQDVFCMFEDDWRSSGRKDAFLPILQNMLLFDPETRLDIHDIAHSLGPLITANVPYLQPLALCNLSYLAHWSMGIGGNNRIFTGDDHRQNLHLIEMTAGQYSQILMKKCPTGVRNSDRKFVLGDLLVTRDSIIDSDNTKCFDLDLRETHRHTFGRGRLVGVLAPHTMVCRQRSPNRKYELAIFEGDTQVMSLHPPTDANWSLWPSICQHATSKWLAVCDYWNRLLCIHDSTGELRYRSTLDYSPGMSDAIICTDSHVIIRQDSSTFLHVHTWSGVVVEKIDLMLIINNEWRVSIGNMIFGSNPLGKVMVINNIGICDGNILHVAMDSHYQTIVGHFWGRHTSLHAFKLITGQDSPTPTTATT